MVARVAPVVAMMCVARMSWPATSCSTIQVWSSGPSRVSRRPRRARCLRPHAVRWRLRGEAVDDAANAAAGAAEDAAGIVTHTWEREWGTTNATRNSSRASGAGTVATRTWENGLRFDEQGVERAQEFIKPVEDAGTEGL